MPQIRPIFLSFISATESIQKTNARKHSGRQILKCTYVSFKHDCIIWHEKLHECKSLDIFCSPKLTFFL